MVDMNALQRVLPVTGLEPQWVAFIDGFSDKPKKDGWQEKITLLEPPSGQHIPYVDALSAMVLLFKHQGLSAEDANAKAVAEYLELGQQDSMHRVVFYGAPGRAHSLGGESPLLARQGEELAERQGCRG